jgi:TRAP-type mannitol/chloroaromatic compound transport system permease small subunit
MTGKASGASWLRPLARTVNATNEWIGRILSVGILPIILLVVYEVVLRYMFRSPTIWGTELVSFLFAGYILLGGGYTLLHRDHVNMDVIYSRLSPRTQAILDVLTASVVFLYCAMLILQGGALALETWELGRTSGTDWNPALFPVQAALPIGAFLMLIQAAIKFVRDLVFALTGRDPLDEH